VTKAAVRDYMRSIRHWSQYAPSACLAVMFLDRERRIYRQRPETATTDSHICECVMLDET
jgi:hypothetical protein